MVTDVGPFVEVRVVAPGWAAVQVSVWLPAETVEPPYVRTGAVGWYFHATAAGMACVSVSVSPTLAWTVVPLAAAVRAWVVGAAAGVLGATAGAAAEAGFGLATLATIAPSAAPTSAGPARGRFFQPARSRPPRLRGSRRGPRCRGPPS